MSHDAVARARSAAVATWGWLAGLGVLTVLVGVVALLAPDVTITLLGVVFGVWLLLSGLGRLALAGVTGGGPGWQRSSGFVVGIVLLSRVDVEEGMRAARAAELEARGAEVYGQAPHAVASIASPGNTTWPFEEDIFSPSSRPIPMMTIPCGQFSGSNSSAWWNR